MKKIGFFGGAFNPPTFAHIALAKHACETCGLDQVIFVPVGKHYPKKDLIDEKHRLRMLEIVCDSDCQLQVSDIELGKEKSYTTIEAFELIASQYLEDKKYFIMGSDNLLQLPNWNRAEELVKNYQFIILERNVEPMLLNILKSTPFFAPYQSQFQLIDCHDYKQISSREVRERWKGKKDISAFVPLEIIEYMKKYHLYE